MLLRGAVTDDSGAPISGAMVGIAIAPEAAPSKPMFLGAAARSCASGQSIPAERDGSVHIVADAAGRFCVRVPLPLDRYAVRISYATNGYVDGTSADMHVDLSRRACALAFAPEPRQISLDTKASTVDAIATLEEDGATVPGAGLTLTLATEQSAGPLATSTTDGGGRARFVFDPAKMGPPGRGELRVSFAGNATASAGLRVAPIERHAHVILDVEGAAFGKLPDGSPDEGVPLVVDVHAAGGAVGSGSVEARVNDAVVGAAPVEAGKAQLLLTFAAPESAGAATEVPVALHYVPNVPWYEPGVESSWRLPLRGRSAWRQLPLVAVGLLVAAWFATTRAQRAKALARAAPKARVVARGEAKVDVLREATDASEGWKGRATDADDGEPVVAARIQVERPAFGRVQVLASQLTDADGRFAIARVDARPGDELAIEAPLHVPLRRPLPAAGELEIQMVERRRALLGRLIAWAKQRGRPFDARPEPTPGHVRQAAGPDLRVARWADAVERAAFGGEPVDAHVEGEVDRLAPSPAVAPPQAAPPGRGAGGGREGHALAHPTKPNR